MLYHYTKESVKTQIFWMKINKIYNILYNRGVRSRTAEGAYAPPVSKQVGEYAPPEIWNSMFLPMLKKTVRGEDGADAKTPQVTSLLLIFYRPTKIHCYNPYLLLGKQRCAKPSGIGVMCPCWFKTGGLIRHWIWRFINALALMLLNKFVPNSTNQ